MTSETLRKLFAAILDNIELMPHVRLNYEPHARYQEAYSVWLFNTKIATICLRETIYPVHEYYNLTITADPWTFTSVSLKDAGIPIAIKPTSVAEAVEYIQALIDLYGVMEQET